MKRDERNDMTNRLGFFFFLVVCFLLFTLIKVDHRYSSF